MLQQTRVEAVIPYYERFLASFPDVEALAAASEPEVLTAWSGLGYYSRARNLHRAAKQVVASGLPADYGQLRELAGIGPYTAAAIASIALGQPHAAVDGNVIRVISRLTNDPGEVSSPATRQRFANEAQRLLDTRSARGFQSSHDGTGRDSLRAALSRLSPVSRRASLRRTANAKPVQNANYRSN